ncbi:MAG: hypothetical protein GY926_09950 [bacterium]|nr:hypothetical protein [bacterium]
MVPRHTPFTDVNGARVVVYSFVTLHIGEISFVWRYQYCQDSAQRPGAAARSRYDV